MKYIRKLEVKIRQIIWAIKQSFLPTTYDIVIYQSNEYYILPSLTGNNTWDLYVKYSKKPTHRRICGSDLKIKNSYRRTFNQYKNKMNFQKQNWESIDCSKPIGSRLSYINSDNIRF